MLRKLDKELQEMTDQSQIDGDNSSSTWKIATCLVETRVRTYRSKGNLTNGRCLKNQDRN